MSRSASAEAATADETAGRSVEATAQPSASLRTSEILAILARAHRGPRIAVGDLAGALGERGFGLWILLLALPNALPGPAIPGFSAVFALPMLALAVQIVLGRSEPRLPRWLLRRSIASTAFASFVTKASPLLVRAERWLRPRPIWLTGRRGSRFLGLGLAALSAVLALPIPFCNWLPAVALSLVGLAMMEEDGHAILVGLGLGLLGCLWLAAVSLLGFEVAERLIGWSGF
jgi:hypothetical protein